MLPYVDYNVDYNEINNSNFLTSYPQLNLLTLKETLATINHIAWVSD